MKPQFTYIRGINQNSFSPILSVRDENNVEVLEVSLERVQDTRARLGNGLDCFAHIRKYYVDAAPLEKKDIVGKAIDFLEDEYYRNNDI